MLTDLFFCFDCSRAPIPPAVEHKTDAPGVDISTEDVKQEASAVADETKQKAAGAEAEAEESAQTLREKAGKAADSAKRHGDEFAGEVEEGYGKAKKEARKDGKKISEEVRSEYNELYENRDNPVVIANAVAIVAGTVALAYGGYQKHQAGELDWKVAGAAGAVVGLLGVGDYFLSQ